MKKILFVFLWITTITVSAQNSLTQIRLNEKWGAVISAIEQVESRGNANAVSSDGKYVGCMQISKILVRQCNIIAGYNKFTYNDRYSRAKSHEMFITFQEYYNQDGDIERAIRLWNSGDLKCMLRKRSTDSYYNRVMQQMTQMAKK